MDHPVFTRPLLATEHSEYDTGAENVAIKLAQQCTRPLTVVMPIISNAEYVATTPEIAGRADDAAAELRQAFAAHAQAAGVAIDVHTRHGLQLWREVVEHAKEMSCDPLVIRRRGRPGLLANLLIGDMVTKVLAHAPGPVLVCPRAAQMWHQRVLVAVSPGGQDGAVLQFAADVARAWALPLTVLRVGDEEARAELESLVGPLRATGLDASIELRAGSPHKEIIAAAQALGADLIVIGSHGTEMMGRAWIGGVAQKVIGLVACPVLVVPPHAPEERPTP
jgi:nucleotide-binding universal stress UspA family protein